MRIYHLYAFITNSCLISGLSAQKAGDIALANMATRVDGYGGVIVIDQDGNVAKSFTTERMAWAWIKEDVLHHGIDIGEDMVDKSNDSNNNTDGDIK